MLVAQISSRINEDVSKLSSCLLCEGWVKQGCFFFHFVKSNDRRNVQLGRYSTSTRLKGGVLLLLGSGREVSFVIEMCHNPSVSYRQRKSRGTLDSEDLKYVFNVVSVELFACSCLFEETPEHRIT